MSLSFIIYGRHTCGWTLRKMQTLQSRFNYSVTLMTELKTIIKHMVFWHQAQLYLLINDRKLTLALFCSSNHCLRKVCWCRECCHLSTLSERVSRTAWWVFWLLLHNYCTCYLSCHRANIPCRSNLRED